MTREEAIAAIRSNELVGKGSCSVIDEGFEDDDLWELVRHCQSVNQALSRALDAEEHHLERGLNEREGNDDDWQLIAYREFKAKRKEAGL